MLSTTVPIGVALALCAGLGQVPTHPDFTGQWVVDSPATAGSDAVVTLTVQQPVSRTNVRGEPIPPAYLSITIRRARASGTTEESRQIGTVGFTVGGVVGPQRQPTATSHHETTWRDGSLVLLNSQSGADGNWSERRESWSFEPDGRLRVEVISEGKDQPRQTSVSLYKRTSK